MAAPAQRFQELRDTYYQKRNEIRARITRFEGIVHENKNEISRLEKELQDTRPKTPNGQRLCQPCDIISMKYTGMRISNDREHWYECEICGHEDYDL